MTGRDSPGHEPQAFMSYARFDDRRRRLTKLHVLIAEEVQSITGEALTIFQDTEEIQTGEQWRRRLEEGLSSATFLIPILTPSFFTSEYCRWELDTFLRDERVRERDDLVLGLHYIDSGLDKPEGDELVEAIRARQSFDWREHEQRRFSDPRVLRALRDFADEIVNAIERVTGRRLSRRPQVADGGHATLSLVVELPPELASTGLSVGVAGSFSQLDGDLPLWRPIPMACEDDRHWRLTLEGVEGEAIAYKYVLAPDLQWEHPEVWPDGAFRENRSAILGETPVQHDVVEAWEGLQRAP